MDKSAENGSPSPRKIPWLGIIIVIVIILAIVQWAMTRQDTTTDNATNDTQSNAYSTSTENLVTPSASTSPALTPPSPTTSVNNKNLMHTITLETNKGTIVFETYDADAPKASMNFVTLANKGFYNGVIFHRVIPGFMIQGGDPTGTGRGGPGYQFADELDSNTPSAKIGYTRGTVAMANSGPNTNGSQFFIMHEDYALPHSYTIFGKVIKGIEVVDAIANTPRNSDDRPLQNVVINKVTVAENK
ncbi:MAG: peptidylprolyl isomerase [Patescibacteria group bacterium]